jgi:hypothetical protein
MAISWGPLIELWRLPQALYGFGDRPQVSHSDRVFHLGGRARGDYGEPPWHLGSIVSPHRSMEISTHKGVNFGIHHHLHVP